MPIYRVDVRVYASAYIRAKSKREALKIARGLKDHGPMIEDGGGDVPITDLEFADPELPPVSLSPCMTIAGATNHIEIM